MKQAILHPFDTIKTRVQASTQDWNSPTQPFWRSALFRDLYRGFLPCVLSGTPGSATFFAAKEAVCSMLANRGVATPLQTVCGVVAGVLSAKAVRTPFDVAETRAMAAGPEDSSAFAWDGSWVAVREVFEAEGVAGLYRGYGANVAYKLPADSAKFLAYEALRGSGAAGSLPPGVAGALATLVANAVTTPLDVVRTRVLLDSKAGSVFDAMSAILATGDYRKWWAGFGWRLIRGVAAGAIQFSVLETTKDVVEGRR